MTIDTTIVYGLLYISLYFEVFLLISFIAHKKNNSIENGDIDKSTLPSVLIIVPCYNEEKTLAKTLESLLTLDYPTKKLSISVVNDGSTDATPTIAESFANKYPQIIAFNKENGGKASAMNLALHKCDSELIGCLDADSFVDSQALKHIITTFSESASIAAVVPAILPTNTSSLLQMMQRAEYSASIFIRKALSIIDAIVITPGPFSIYKTNIIKKLGGWEHAHGTEDLQMGLRLQESHYRIANQPSAIVHTITPSTLSALYKQRIRWMYGLLMNAWEYKHMIGNKKYGNAGLLILPIALLSIFGAIIMFAVFMTHLVIMVADLVTHLSITGFGIHIITLDAFYLPINAILLIALTLIGLWLFILSRGALLANTRVFYKDIALYLTLYGILAPIWLTDAAARALVRAESKWKVIR